MKTPFIKETAETRGMRFRLMLALEKMGLTERGSGTKIARATGYSPKEVCYIINGNKQLNDAMVKNFCTVFGISEQWISEGTGEMFDECGPSQLGMGACPARGGNLGVMPLVK